LNLIDLALRTHGESEAANRQSATVSELSDSDYQPTSAPDDAKGHVTRGIRSSAVVGAIGSAFLALASNLPGSPYGPQAGGLWPLAGKGAAPGWEGPTVPWWAVLANRGPGVAPGHLLTTLLAVLGVVLLCLGWGRLLRVLRAEPDVKLRTVCWPVCAWIAPLLLSAPFASQDVWIYGAQGKMVLSGLGASRPVALLGHSTWLSGVDPKWALRPSIYGPGSLDISALFVRISGGRPWVAAECWRLVVILSLVLCAWGAYRIVSARGREPKPAVVAAVLNPGILIALVASIHNDALMVGLMVAGIAMAVSRKRWPAFALCALAITIKAPAALALLAVAWWAWKSGWLGRAVGLVTGAVMAVGALVVTGLLLGGGFDWVKSASLGLLTSSFSIADGLMGITSAGVADTIQVAGITLAVVLLLRPKARDNWITTLALSFAIMAFCAVNPQPWYLPWIIVLLACGGMREGVERACIVLLVVMMAWSEMPLGTVVWFVGAFAFLGVGLLELRGRLDKLSLGLPVELRVRLNL
jgi:alpha-1,6-mannosyltransferase